jgi:hypothetical protein
VDFEAPSGLVEQFSLKGTLSLGAFTLLDNVFSAFGRGALLRAQLRKPN